ncbi:MAG: PhoX family phosphatase [Gammaproteobacteria bacterium]|nr:PhoX family phosphatase [Gammaproteobacteria bacterium]
MSTNNVIEKPIAPQRSFAEVLEVAVARRSVLQGGIGLAVVGIFGRPLSIRAQDSGDTNGETAPVIEFTPVTVQDAANQQHWPLISEDYDYDLILPWGEPIRPDGPAFTHPPSPDNQEVQIGIGHDGMWFFPHPEDIPNEDETSDDESTDTADDDDETEDLMNTRGVLVINHEFGSNSRVLDSDLPSNLDEVRASQHAHGVSVVSVERIDGKWQIVESEKSRRIHVNTPVTFSGPAAEHDLLKNRNEYEPKGTLNNCANGFTPWGTYLTCEENFHQYFSETPYSVENQRYGLTYTAGDSYGWFRRDSRFRLSSPLYPNEGNRFGWVVEIDPHDPNHVPVKHTALGRFRHEGAAVAVGQDDRIAVYMGDDTSNEYIYKYVNDESYKDVLEREESPLAAGQLYVARFDDDFTGEWLPLTLENEELADRFDDDADMLVHARIAADLLGATKMDRPEWITVAPNESVYCTLTGNSLKSEENAANPENPNDYGHIIRWKDADMHVGTTFEWDIFKLASSTQATEEMFGNPDGLYVDQDGRLFIQTDGGQGEGAREICNQLLVADTTSGDVYRLFTGVDDCEITGVAFTPDRKTMFINIQHPGWDNFETSLSTQEFPGIEGPNVPRDCTVVITRKDGGVVGS